MILVTRQTARPRLILVSHSYQLLNPHDNPPCWKNPHKWLPFHASIPQKTNDVAPEFIQPLRGKCRLVCPLFFLSFYSLCLAGGRNSIIKAERFISSHQPLKLSGRALEATSFSLGHEYIHSWNAIFWLVSWPFALPGIRLKTNPFSDERWDMAFCDYSLLFYKPHV
jgi:hypothetical protein